MHPKKDILLISDLHLSEARPDITCAFYLFLTERAIFAKKLIILGDFFELWLGDDLITPLAYEVAIQLKALRKTGTEIYFIHGNRDFAIGETYAKLCGMTLLPEFYTLHTPNGTILLCHGDQLCTLDTAYQRWRKWIRYPLILWVLRHSPKMFRLKLGRKARAKSTHIQQKTHNVLDTKKYDVVETAVDAALEKHCAQILIHGHTHKPADYPNRYVLSDWDKNGDYLCIRLDENPNKKTHGKAHGKTHDKPHGISRHIIPILSPE